MPIMAKQEETLSEFKELREELGMSYQQITDITEANGESVSIATVKRVFSPGAADQKFRAGTLNAIGKVLFDEKMHRQMSGEEAPSHEVDALNSLLAYNKLTIETLEKENARLETDYEKKLAYIKAEGEKKHEHILALTQQNDAHIKQIKKKDKTIGWLVFAIIALLVVIIAALIVDRINPDLGYFWRGMSALISGEGDVLSGHDIPGTVDVLLTYIIGARP